MGAYDQASRYITKAQPSAFFRWRAPALGRRWTFRGWLDTRGIAFPGEPDRTCDTVAEFVSQDDTQRRAVVDVEFEAEPDADMLERLGEYAVRLRRERRYGPGQAGKYAVLSLRLNLTGAEQTHELDMNLEDWAEAGLRLRVAQGTLSQEDAAQTLAQIAAGELERWILPWLPLLMENRFTSGGTCDNRNKCWNGKKRLGSSSLASTCSRPWRCALVSQCRPSWRRPSMRAKTSRS